MPATSLSARGARPASNERDATTHTPEGVWHDIFTRRLLSILTRSGPIALGQFTGQFTVSQYGRVFDHHDGS
jgi:hypothetical protein